MPPESPWSCILWDVDGTIVDASDGILHRLTVTLEHFDRPAPTRAELVHWIGPPMFDSFQAQAGMDAELPPPRSPGTASWAVPRATRPVHACSPASPS
jgi:phosphoglycolate phosphatase-like HAD superfamily hydrolase